MVEFDEPEAREEGIKIILFIHTKLVEVLVPIYGNILKITSDFTKYY